MGCGGSKDSTSGSPAAGNHVVFERRPKISVRIGSKVQKLDNKPTLIFIFGKLNIFIVRSQNLTRRSDCHLHVGKWC